MTGLEAVEGTKVCQRCHRRDELDEFPPKPRVSDGRSSCCPMPRRRDGGLGGGRSRQGELRHPGAAGEARAAAVCGVRRVFVLGARTRSSAARGAGGPGRAARGRRGDGLRGGDCHRIAFGGRNHLFVPPPRALTAAPPKREGADERDPDQPPGGAEEDVLRRIGLVRDKGRVEQPIASVLTELPDEGENDHRQERHERSRSQCRIRWCSASARPHPASAPPIRCASAPSCVS